MLGEGRVVKSRQRFWSLGLKKQLIILGLLGLSFLTGCATPSQNPSLYTGAGLGAALGAGLGAAINHGNPWRGAAIGGLLGCGRGWRSRSSLRAVANPLSAATAGVLSAAPAGSLPAAAGDLSAALLWAAARLSGGPEANRIPVAERFKKLAPGSESPRGFAYGKMEKI